MNIAKPRHSTPSNSTTYPAETSTRPNPTIEPVRRFLVLVPSPEIDLSVAAKRLWELAKTTGAHIQFLSVYNDPEQEPSLRRALTTLSTMVKDERITTSTEVILERNWGSIVNSHAQSIDLVVYFPEKRRSGSQRVLNQILQSDPTIPLYILSDPSTEKVTTSSLPTQVATWVGFLSVIAIFFLFQAKITLVSPDWFRTVLMIGSTLVEFGVIWLLNNLL